jgi:hypothetical protein
MSDLIKRLRRRAEIMEALGHTKGEFTKAGSLEAKLTLIQGAKDNAEAATEIEALRRENQELRAALEPFVKRAERFDDIPGVYTCHDNVELWQDGNWRCDLTVGDLRRARALTMSDIHREQLDRPDRKEG